MSELSPRLGIPLLMPAQAQKHVTHNEALLRLDQVTQLVLQALAAADPPADPPEGGVWALGPSPSGAWTGHAGALAMRLDGTWQFVVPMAGWQATFAGAARVFDGSAWVAPAVDALQGLAGVGINATHDATNRLSVAAPATLLSHEGGGHQLKLNKASPSDTASLLFQTGFAGRAEMGTAGSDDLSIKVSPNGSIWSEALRARGSDGRVTLPGGLVVGGAVALPAAVLVGVPALVGGTADAIELTSFSGLTGLPPPGLELRFRAVATNPGATTIALDGGAPVPCRTITGAVLPPGYIRTDADTVARLDGAVWVLDRQPERGGNSNGTFVRTSDGTQMCHHRLVIKPAADATSGTKAVTWIFPAEFSGNGAAIRVVHAIDTTNPELRGRVSSRALTSGTADLRYSEGGITAVDVWTGAIAIGRWY